MELSVTVTERSSIVCKNILASIYHEQFWSLVVETAASLVEGFSLEARTAALSVVKQEWRTVMEATVALLMVKAA